MDIGQFHIGGPAILSLMGALIVAIGAFISSADQQRAQQQADQAQEQVLEKTEKIEKLAAAITETAKQNSALNEKIIGLTTGGDSFAYLSFAKASSDDDAIRFPVVVQQGSFPLFELGVRIVDLIEFHSTPNHSLETLNKYSLQVGALPAGQTYYQNKMIFNINPDGHEFNVFFTARNGVWQQNIEFFEGPNGELQYKSKVIRTVDGVDEIIHKE